MSSRSYCRDKFGWPRWGKYFCKTMIEIGGDDNDGSDDDGIGVLNQDLTCWISSRLMDYSACHISTNALNCFFLLSFLTTWTLESLMGDTVKHRAAVVAEGWRQVREHLPFVLLARLRTRNSARESPVLHLWSDPVWRRDRNEMVTIGISIWHPKRRNPVIGKKRQASRSLLSHFLFFYFCSPLFSQKLK